VTKARFAYGGKGLADLHAQGANCVTPNCIWQIDFQVQTAMCNLKYAIRNVL
jgi:hypothetical protein